MMFIISRKYITIQNSSVQLLLYSLRHLLGQLCSIWQTPAPVGFYIEMRPLHQHMLVFNESLYNQIKFTTSELYIDDLIVFIFMSFVMIIFPKTPFCVVEMGGDHVCTYAQLFSNFLPCKALLLQIPYCLLLFSQDITAVIHIAS